MEVDTGALRSTVSQYVYNTLLNDFPLQNTDVTLRSYSGEKVPILGKISVPVKYSSNDEKVLDLASCSTRKTPSFIWEGLVKQDKARLGEYFQTDRTCREQVFCSQV